MKKKTNCDFCVALRSFLIGAAWVLGCLTVFAGFYFAGRAHGIDEGKRVAWEQYEKSLFRNSAYQGNRFVTYADDDKPCPSQTYTNVDGKWKCD